MGEYRGRMAVAGLCRLLGVNRSWYYSASRREAQGLDPDAALRGEIERILGGFSGYGYRRVTKELRRRRVLVNHKRVLRVMRESGLLCRRRRRRVVTTDSVSGGRAYPNLTGELEVTEPDRLWVADITYVRLRSGFAYLAAILDAYSRKVVGWSLSRTLETPLVLEALHRALKGRRPEPGWVHHSDRASQYRSEDYVAALERAGGRISMSRRGNPYENALAESFFGTLKVEKVYQNEYATYEDARQSIEEFIEEVYNRRRLHSSLGYVPPDEYERTRPVNMGVTPA